MSPMRSPGESCFEPVTLGDASPAVEPSGESANWPIPVFCSAGEPSVSHPHSSAFSLTPRMGDFRGLQPRRTTRRFGIRDNTVAVWDLDTGTRIHSLTGHHGPVTSVAVSHDGRRIVSGSEDNTVAVWDLDAGTRIHSLSGHKNS